MWHSRTHSRTGILSDHARPVPFDTTRPLLIVGNGPSATDPRYDRLPDDPVVFRMNWFFLEERYHYGRRVDAFLYGIPHAKLEAHLQHVIDEGWYDVDCVLSPMLVPTGRADEAHASTLWRSQVPQGDHWAAIAENPQLARFMMGRPLPTQGMQALATGLLLGFTDLTLVGVDLYSSTEQRYGHPVPDDVRRALQIKDLAPGYESAHALDRDLDFLDTCLAQFPGASVKQIGPSPHLQARLPEPTRRERPATFAGVPGSDLAQTPKPTFQPRYAPGGVLAVRTCDPLPFRLVDGRRCGYVTMVSGPTFHHGTRALARSLAKVSDVPLLALCTPSADQAALRASGIATVTVPEITNPNTLRANALRFSSTYTKLQAFRMTHLDRLVFLDSDMIVLRELDELFAGTGFAAVADHGTDYHYDRFNSGLFAVDPSQQLFDALLAEVGRIRSYDYGDQGFLNQMFPDWQRLPHEFNVNKRWSTLHPLAFNPAQTRVLHFVGVKPWQPDVATEFDELHELWFAQLSAAELADLAKYLRVEAASATKQLAVERRTVPPTPRSVRRWRPRVGASGSPVRQGSLIRRAQTLMRSGAVAEALRLLENEWPGDATATAGLFRERAKALVLSGQLDAGFAAIDEAAERHPTNAAIQQLRRLVGRMLRVRQTSGGIVGDRTVALAGRLYTRMR